MANGYTEHYGLCQWAAEDSFLREEFNQDNAKIDGALNTLSEELSEAQEENEEKLDPIRYNLYQLWLQRYYEGKETGMKKALLFDGFLDGSLVAALTQGTFLHGGSVWLSGTGQDSITGQTQTGGIAAQGGTVESDVVTADGYGYLTGCTLEESYLGASASAVVTVTVEFLLNGKVQAARQVTMRGSESVFSISAGKRLAPLYPQRRQRQSCGGRLCLYQRRGGVRDADQHGLCSGRDDPEGAPVSPAAGRERLPQPQRHRHDLALCPRDRGRGWKRLPGGQLGAQRDSEPPHRKAGPGPGLGRDHGGTGLRHGAAVT